MLQPIAMTSDEFASKKKQTEAETEDNIVQSQPLTDFDAAVQKLIERSELHRVSFMERFRFRGFISMTLSLALVVIGGSGFGWFLIMEADLVKALASILLTACMAFLLHNWASQPLKDYKREYKEQFMPEMAKLLGNLAFHTNRGIKETLLPKTGIVPRFGTYKTLDCFMGVYKDAKIILSEVHLSHRHNKSDTVFSGIFVMLSMPQEEFKGHTIITSHISQAEKWEKTRWKKLQNIEPADTQCAHNYKIYSDKPKYAQNLLQENLFKELNEMSELFNNAPISLCFFRKSRVFLMIPYEEDMFEPSNLYVPITTKQNAIKLKKEIDQLLSIVDILNVYKAKE